MSAKKRIREKGRRTEGGFASLPHAVTGSKNWQNASGNAIKLVIELFRQFNGRNNGDLCGSYSVLKKRGWRSADTVNNAIKEAMHYGLIVKTRQGGLNKANLFAVTWNAIDDCKGKLDLMPTSVPSRSWQEERPIYQRPQRKISAES